MIMTEGEPKKDEGSGTKKGSGQLYYPNPFRDLGLIKRLLLR